MDEESPEHVSRGRRRAAAVGVGAVGALLALCLAAPAGMATTPAPYRMTLLPDRGAESSGATAISPDGGEVAGVLEVHGPAGEEVRSARWRDGRLRVIRPAAGPFSRPLGISPEGVLAGATTTGGSDLAVPAISERGGPWSPLPTLGGLPYGAAAARSGEVTVGYVTDADEEMSAPFVHTPSGGTRSLGSLGGTNGRATDVNGRGAIVGWSQTEENPFRSEGFVLAPGASLDSAERIPGLGGRTTFARAVNEWGAVVGDAADASGITHAFLRLPSGEIRTIASPVDGERYVLARDVNDRLQVVGDAPSDDEQRAWYWDPDRGRAWLDDIVSMPPGWTLSYATAIAQDGSIAADAVDQDGGVHAAVLRPRNPSHPAGAIAFVSERDGDDEISVMPSRGGPARALTVNTGVDRAPQWSPDGRWLAFNSRRETHPDRLQVYRLRVHNAQAVRVTTSTAPAEDQRASWAPDGRSLYFQRGTFTTGFTLWRSSVDGSRATPITAPPTSGTAIDAAADANPRTGSVVFQTNRGSAGIFPFRLARLDASGTIAEIPLAVTASIDGPRWSPDGRTIAFAAGGDIYVHRPRTGVLRQVTSGPEGDLSPDWSPDGRALVFQSDRFLEDGGLHVVDLSSGAVRFIGEGRTPVWTARQHG